ncbi:Multiple antibiotic resistance protein marR,DNA-binding transcriptional repressor MarR,MarR family [Burkholderia stabilis]|uniref:Multiple antibiotic resistance protein marR,DNA-binding transcriptional repressor MarR,MarR family n=2 Tax=Burkholderia stabilis TaxID=95485 RepID=A0AAJ5N848_9BURK|nr:Multiple antibiotic resistance protein marR,DNA-binding transcriptional repressor MarR,MarR family [Burkholderia stabilis]
MLVDEHNNRIAEALGIAPSDLMLLYALRRTPEPHCMRPTEVFRLLSVTSGAATYRIDRLVKQDLALRVDDPEDRRSYLLQLSEKGKTMANRAVEVLAEDSNACIRELSSTRLEEIRKTLHEIEEGWMRSVPVDQNPLARVIPKGDSPSV